MYDKYAEAMIDEMAFIFGMEREEVEEQFHKNGILNEEENEKC